MTDSMVRQYLASDAAREHYAKTMPELGSFVDPREARITKLEAEVESFQKQVANYGGVVQVIISDLIELDQRHKKVIAERDMLATRCAAQAHEIAELLSPPIKDIPDPVLAAIEVHQKQGVR